MKKYKYKAQGALEILIIFGILIIAIIIFLFFYFGNKNRTEKSSSIEGITNAVPVEGVRTSMTVCGNFICEYEENKDICPKDCSG